MHQQIRNIYFYSSLFLIAWFFTLKAVIKQGWKKKLFKYCCVLLKGVTTVCILYFMIFPELTENLLHCFTAQWLHDFGEYQQQMVEGLNECWENDLSFVTTFKTNVYMQRLTDGQCKIDLENFPFLSLESLWMTSSFEKKNKKLNLNQSWCFTLNTSFYLIWRISGSNIYCRFVGVALYCFVVYQIWINEFPKSYFLFDYNSFSPPSSFMVSLRTSMNRTDPSYVSLVPKTLLNGSVNYYPHCQ